MARPRRRGGFGYIVERGPGAFAIRWRENGRLKFKSGFKTKRAAADELAALRAGIADGTLIQKRRAEVGFDQVANEWLNLHSAAALRSHALNADNYRRHVAPFLGDCPLVSVTAKRILELRANLQAKTYRRRHRRKDGKVVSVEKPLSSRMVNLVMALVRSILRFAVANGHIPSAPTDLIARGKLMLPVEKGKLAPPIAKPEDVGRLLDAIREIAPRRFAMFAALVYTGMRKGEACGLRWADVDLDKRIIMVRRSYGGWTKSSKHRDVPIPADLVTILRQHRNEEPYGGELCFPNDRGEVYSKNGKLEDVLGKGLASIGLPRIRVHDLRHVYGAHFVMAGGSIFDLQRNLGHHSVAFTASVYGHLSQDHRVKESDRLSGLFAAPAPTADNVIPIAKRTDSAIVVPGTSAAAAGPAGFANDSR
jgi:integrase